MGLKQKSHLIILLIITVIAALLRLPALTTSSFWFDELQSMITADPAYDLSHIEEVCKQSFDPAPRTFYYILYAWMSVFGSTEFSARLLVALFGIASVPVMYLLGLALFNKRAAIIASLFTAVNFYNIYYSVEVRFYPVLFFLAALSYLFFTRMLKEPGVKNALLYAIITLLLILTHYFALLLLVTQLLSWLALKRRSLLNWRGQRYPLSSFLIVVLAFLPFVPGLLETISLNGAGQAFDGGHFFFVDYFKLYFGMHGITVLTALVCFALFLLKALQDPTDSSERQSLNSPFLLLAWLIMPVLIAYIRTLYSSSALAERYCIVVVPALLLIVARGCEQVPNQLLKSGLIILFITGNFIRLFPVSDFYKVNAKDDFRGIAAKIKASQSTGHTYYVFSDKNWHLRYYLQKERLQPQLIDLDNPVDQRFYTGRALTVPALIADTSVKDLWVTTAHFSRLEEMKGISRLIHESRQYLKIDSFIGKDAFADHYIRLDFKKGIIAYEKMNGISLLPGKFVLQEKQRISEEGFDIVAMWDGSMSSEAIPLQSGQFTLSLVCKGSISRDTISKLQVQINKKTLTTIACQEQFTSYRLPFHLKRDTAISVGLNLVNDYYDKATGQDRNVFIRSLVIRR